MWVRVFQELCRPVVVVVVVVVAAAAAVAVAVFVDPSLLSSS